MSFLSGIETLSFWWNFLAGIIDAASGGAAVGAAFFLAVSVVRRRHAKEALGYALVLAATWGALAWVCYQKAGYRGFILGFVFPGLFVAYRMFAAIPRQIVDGIYSEI